MKAMSRQGRAARRAVILLFTIASALTAFLLLLLRHRFDPPHRQRAQWLHRWCIIGLRRLRIPVECRGDLPSRGLLACNHLSYLDILVLSSLLPCIFVSKAEVRGWPVFGWLARSAGSIFIRREQLASAHEGGLAVRELLQQGTPVVIFPEGTSSDGSAVLPFRPLLFQSAIASGEKITAVHLAYEMPEGDVGQEVCYWGEMTLVPHLWNLLSRAGVRAIVTVASAPELFSDRKQAAMLTQQRIAAASGRHVTTPQLVTR